MCSTWLLAVFREMTRRSAISFCDMPRARSRSTSTSRVVSPGHSRLRRTWWPAARSTASTPPSKRPALTSSRRRAATARASSLAVGPRLGPRSVAVGHREQTPLGVSDPAVLPRGYPEPSRRSWCCAATGARHARPGPRTGCDRCSRDAAAPAPPRPQSVARLSQMVLATPIRRGRAPARPGVPSGVRAQVAGCGSAELGDTA